MRLTRLRLNGFKSFVDPTDLAIAEGLTGVVGPNGCGKSNLLEALRWVMGETRASAMRGDGMADVIFAGAATRPARAFAEVALVLDNAERRAPAGMNDADTLEIARRITRDARSVYRAAGREVRARDVQLLFADASTGALSPGLVRQGQIAELIAARPAERRRILEEAAGVAGLHARRHEANLRLAATEANLARTGDVVEALAVQLAGLERQVRQAARYREIGASLRRAEAALVWRRWRDAADGAEAAAATALTLRAEAARAETAAARAEAARAEAEAALPAARDETAIAAAVRQRLAQEAASIKEDAARAEASARALTARAAELARDADREAALDRDAGETLAWLAEEAATLATADAGQADAERAADARAHAAASALAALEDARAGEAEAVARLAARHQAAARALGDARLTRDRVTADAAKAGADLAAAAAGLDGAEADAAAADIARAAAEAAGASAEAALLDADARRATLAERETAARSERSASEGEARTLKAEAAALDRLIARDTGEATQMLDRITVEPGWELALGAALGDDLRLGVRTGGSGWTDLGPFDAVPLPAGVEPLIGHVAAPPVLARRLTQIGVVAAEAGDAVQALLAPGQRAVSVAGDLWRWDGYMADAATAPAATAERLRQVNRRSALERERDTAEARAAGTRQAHEVLAAALAEAVAAELAARSSRRAADDARGAAERAHSRAEADRNLARARHDTGTLTVSRFRDAATTAERDMAEAEAARAGLGDLDAARATAEAGRDALDAARAEMLRTAADAEGLRREGAARARRAEAIARDRATWDERRRRAGARTAELAARRTETEARLADARAAPAGIEARRARVADAAAAAEARERRALQVLAAAEDARTRAADTERAAERVAGNARTACAAAEARADDTARAAADARARMDAAPDAVRADAGASGDIPPASVAEAEVARLNRQREALGSVNLRAEEDARAIGAEHDALVTDRADLEAAVAALRTGIAALNREGRERLMTAFETVNAEFGRLFRRLFGGGSARLVLVASDDPLEAGLEILCEPPGKRLASLSLLSGGEQTLTALALIFAVFLANPAPVCVLDEVDAPLDDANVARFCDLLDAMVEATETRFLVITHHAVTMARMDRLYGVTMAEPGVSQLVSVDLRAAEALVA